MRFGRNRPADLHTAKHIRFSLAKAAGVLPAIVVPAYTNFSVAAAPIIADIYGNDVEGDCVPAGVSHARGVVTANWRPPAVHYTLSQINQLYTNFSGYDPSQTQPDGSNPTDQGCDENTAFQSLKAIGFPDGAKVCHAIAVDATNTAEVREAFFLTGNLIYGMELDRDWINPMPSASGFVWDVGSGSDPDAGHCVAGVDLVPGGILIATWGMTGTITDAATAKYATPANGGQLFCYVTDDVLAAMAARFNFSTDAFAGYLDSEGVSA